MQMMEAEELSSCSEVWPQYQLVDTIPADARFFPAVVSADASSGYSSSRDAADGDSSQPRHYGPHKTRGRNGLSAQESAKRLAMAEQNVEVSKNALAARKSRYRKKEAEIRLQDQAQRLAETNDALHFEVAELKQQVALLRAAVHDHAANTCLHVHQEWPPLSPATSDSLSSGQRSANTPFEEHMTMPIMAPMQ